MTKNELVESIGERCGNIYTGHEVWDEVCDFFAAFVEQHDDWSAEGIADLIRGLRFDHPSNSGKQ